MIGVSRFCQVTASETGSYNSLATAAEVEIDGVRSNLFLYIDNLDGTTTTADYTTGDKEVRNVVQPTSSAILFTDSAHHADRYGVRKVSLDER